MRACCQQTGAAERADPISLTAAGLPPATPLRCPGRMPVGSAASGALVQAGRETGAGSEECSHAPGRSLLPASVPGLQQQASSSNGSRASNRPAPHRNPQDPRYERKTRPKSSPAMSRHRNTTLVPEARPPLRHAPKACPRVPLAQAPRPKSRRTLSETALSRTVRANPRKRTVTARRRWNPTSPIAHTLAKKSRSILRMNIGLV